jgi:hypothetical protein
LPKAFSFSENSNENNVETINEILYYDQDKENIINCLKQEKYALEQNQEIITSQMG